MKPVIATLVFLMCAGAFASDFYLYRDKAEYRTGSTGGVLGYSETLKAYCGESEILTAPSNAPVKGTWLGAIDGEITKNESAYESAEKRKQVAEFMLGSLGEVSYDKLADGKIRKYVTGLFEEISKAEADMKKANEGIEILKALFAKGTDGRYAVRADSSCADLRLVLDKITADYENVLRINGNSAKTELVLKAVNRSGVDIDASNAYLLPSYLNAPINIPQFDSWYVRPFEPVVLSRTMKTSAAPLMTEAADFDASEVTREAPSQFRVTNFKLASSGQETRFVLDSADVDTESRLAVYPFRSPVVYRETVFTPRSEVYGNKWRVIKDRENFDNVYSTVENGKIRLAAGTDKDISVKRSDLPLTRESDGFFGTKKRMKRGYTIEVSNLSGVSKKLSITDRVPVAADDRISIENTVVNGKKLSPSKDGKLEIITEIAAGGTVKYEVTFELVADKDMDVVF